MAWEPVGCELAVDRELEGRAPLGREPAALEPVDKSGAQRAVGREKLQDGTRIRRSTGDSTGTLAVDPVVMPLTGDKPAAVGDHVWGVSESPPWDLGMMSLCHRLHA